jgi:gluconate 2-dehydrogenase gamma chain
MSTRREFVVSTSLLGAWLAAAAACRKETADDAASHGPPPGDSVSPPRLATFTPDEGADIEAIAARIIPADDTPGAREAGVLYFIDRYVATPDVNATQSFRDGLAQLARDVAARHGANVRFASLTADQQDDMLRAMEKTDFFGAIRFATICGMFALPRYGGNRDYIGWKLIGQETGFEFSPPFGWYDRPENQQALLGRVL